MIRISRAAITDMTLPQFTALRKEVLANWKQVKDEDISITLEPLGDTIMVQLPNILIGIEADGYTHS